MEPDISQVALWETNADYLIRQVANQVTRKQVRVDQRKRKKAVAARRRQAEEARAAFIDGIVSLGDHFDLQRQGKFSSAHQHEEDDLVGVAMKAVHDYFHPKDQRRRLAQLKGSELWSFVSAAIGSARLLPLIESKAQEERMLEGNRRNANRTSEGREPHDVSDLQWEILPPGSTPNLGETRFDQHDHGAEMSTLRSSRIQWLDRQHPRAWYRGTHLGKTAYFVALFDNVAIADCDDDGNALYYAPVISWKSILRLSKSEARRAGAKRIFHSGDDWRLRVQQLIELGIDAP